uniref:Uncharacterized protein n=1 Tax=Ditylenchus dipsaci TaxID=166011 RepID=A0A915DFN8_9BILA
MSNYRIAHCPNIDSSHVCTKGCGGHTASSFNRWSVLAPTPWSTLCHRWPKVSLCLLLLPCIFPTCIGTTQEVDMPYSTYPLNWGYNRDYYLSNDVKFMYKMPQSRQQYARPYSGGLYNVSRYHVQYPSHMYHPILNDFTGKKRFRDCSSALKFWQFEHYPK